MRGSLAVADGMTELLVTGATSLLWRCTLGGSLAGCRILTLPRELTVSHLPKAQGPRALLHMAYAHVDNDALTKRALDAATAAGCHRVLHASTGSVYGHNWDGFAAPSRAPQPVTAYAHDKLRAEELINAWAAGAKGRSAANLRFFFPTMPLPALKAAAAEGRTHRMVTRIAASLLAGETITLEERSFAMNPASPALVATVLGHCVGAPRLPPAMNVAGGEETTLEALVKHMASLLGVEPRIRHGSAAPRSMLGEAPTLSRGVISELFPASATRA